MLRDRRSGCIGTIVTGTHHGTTILQRHGVCGLRHVRVRQKKGSAICLETIWGLSLLSSEIRSQTSCHHGFWHNWLGGMLCDGGRRNEWSHHISFWILCQPCGLAKRKQLPWLDLASQAFSDAFQWLLTVAYNRVMFYVGRFAANRRTPFWQMSRHLVKCFMDSWLWWLLVSLVEEKSSQRQRMTTNIWRCKTSEFQIQQNSMRSHPCCLSCEFPLHWVWLLFASGASAYIS